MIQQSHSWDISRKDKNSNLKRHMHPNVYSSTIYNSQDMEATKVSIDRWMDKEDVVCISMCVYTHTHTHTQNGILLSNKKEWNNAICSKVDGPTDYHTKWSKSDRERQILYIIIYMWNLKNNTNEFTYKQTHRQKTNFWLPKVKGWGREEG